MRSVNLGIEYDHPVAGRVIPGEHRWIGRCKKCGKTHQVYGEVALMHAPKQKLTTGPWAGYEHGGADFVIRTANGLYTAGDSAGIGSFHSKVRVPCGDHWKTLEMVTEGTKKSKHECGARCTNATGPNCDCKCKGKNHGSNC